MSKESWYKGNPEDIIKIDTSDNFIVDYDKSRGMYRVSVFDDGHFWDEFWFDAYEYKETKEFPMEIKRFERPMAVREDAWWCGYCPKCGIMLNFNYADPNRDNRKQYCWHCGQLVDFGLNP